MNIPSLSLRKLKAEMALKGVSLSALSARAKVNYTVASAILNGTRHQPANLKKITDALATFEMPAEEEAA